MTLPFGEIRNCICIGVCLKKEGKLDEKFFCRRVFVGVKKIINVAGVGKAGSYTTAEQQENKVNGPRPHEILQEMANTYRERNAVYGDNFRMVGKMMAVLFPAGVSAELLHSDQFHLFELMLVKLSRYAISNLSHIDSVHDLAVYGAMCEAINREKEEK